MAIDDADEPTPSTEAGPIDADALERLDQATRAVREDEPTGWVELSQAIMGRIRTLVTPAATVMAFGDDGRATFGDRGSTVQVSGRVLTPRLRAALDGPRRAVDSIDLAVTDGRCSSVRIGLVCSFGSDLQAEGADVRVAVAQVVLEVLGLDPSFDPSRDIEVEIVDVVEGDARHA